MSKNRFIRVLALVLTICMVMGMFAGTVSAAEPAAAVTADATASVTLTSEGHYLVEFVLSNPTEDDLSITLHKTAGDADFNYRGTSANNGAITLAAMSEQKVSGYLSFTDAENQLADVTVEVRSGTTVLDTVTIDVIDAIPADPEFSHVVRAATFDFSDGAQGWNGTPVGGALEMKESWNVAYGSNLKLIPGHLYRLTLRAKSTGDKGGFFARVSDFDKDGKALATPMSLYQLTVLSTGYEVYEYRFVANTTGDIAAKEYADELYLRVYVKDTKGRYVYSPLMPYSVQEYCEGRLEKSTDAKMVELAKQLVMYGERARLYLG